MVLADFVFEPFSFLLFFWLFLSGETLDHRCLRFRFKSVFGCEKNVKTPALGTVAVAAAASFNKRFSRRQQLLKHGIEMILVGFTIT